MSDDANSKLRELMARVGVDVDKPPNPDTVGLWEKWDAQDAERKTGEECPQGKPLEK